MTWKSRGEFLEGSQQDLMSAPLSRRASYKVLYISGATKLRDRYTVVPSKVPRFFRPLVAIVLLSTSLSDDFAVVGLEWSMGFERFGRERGRKRTHYKQPATIESDRKQSFTVKTRNRS